MLLISCSSQPTVKSKIASCYVPENIKSGDTYKDLVFKFIEHRQYLIVCAERVEGFNAKE